MTNQILCISTCYRPMATKHGKRVTLRDLILPINSQNPLNKVHVRSRDKSKTLYLHYHNVFFHKICQVDGICEELPPTYFHDPSMKSSFKVTWQIKYNISPPSGDLMDTRLDKVLSYFDRLPTLKPLHPLIMWPKGGHVTT